MAKKDRNENENTGKKKKKKSTGIGFALFMLVFIVLAIVIIVKLPEIKENISAVTDKSNNQSTVVKTEQVSKEESNQKDLITREEEKTITIKIENPAGDSSKEKPAAEEKKPEVKKEEKSEEKKTQKEQKVEKPAVETKPAPEKISASETTQVSYTELSLCFVEIDAEGYVNRKIIKRSVPKNDSPLSTAIKLLLEGPDVTKAAERNCSTLIPEGTKLLSAKVQNGVAYLSFNDKFEFNSAGIDGTDAQLMQIVYTATSFSTVTSVQFLIEGEKKDYLEMEGRWIGSPLSRSSFR